VGVDPEDVGKEVSCPYCNTVFTARKKSKPKLRVEHEDEDRPKKRRRQEDDEDEDYEDRTRKRSRGRRPVETKRITAGILAIVIGGLGVHKFYLGYTTAGFLQILLSCVGVGGIIGLVEGLIYLTKTDEEFYEIYERGEKHWF
jgi:TM2 domain-containing membrane protein YozV